MKHLIKYSKDLVRHNKVKLISSSEFGMTFEVEEQIVRLFNKKGVMLISCSCQNHGRHSDLSEARQAVPLCRHKVALTFYLIDDDFSSKLDKVIGEYEDFKRLKLPVSIDCFIEDLKKIRDKR